MEQLTVVCHVSVVAVDSRDI